MGRPTLIQRWSRLVAVGVRDLSAAEFTVWSSWCGLLLALESLGRRSGEEWVDFGAAVALLLWSAATAVVHQARPLRLISALRKFLPRRAMLVRHLMLDWGVDLRRTPPIRRRLPGAWCVLAFGILAASVAVWLAVTQSPSGVRNWLASRFYLAYLVPWAALVGVALFLISVLTFLIWAELQEHSESRSRAGRPPGGRRDLLVIAIAAALLVLGVGYLKTWIPLAGMGVVLAGLSIALLLTSRDLVLIWRQEIRGRYGSFDGRLFIWFQAAAVIVLLADLALLLGGRPELPRGFDWGVSPLVSAAKLPPPSLILARLIGWLSLGAAIGVGFDACRLAILGITFHPSRIGRTEGRDLAAADFGVRRQAEVK
ncbi:MAG: hypothetical protein EHM42_01485, partial [Planctomycetaceae bacterium]